MSETKKFYVTTPIYYANDEPHIGHSYTTILADVLTRYHQSAGEETFFLTGLDEHGLKVQQAAEANGIDPQDHCDKMAPKWKALWEKLHIRYSNFIRTTEPRHEKVVQDVLNNVNDAGDIYVDEYGGHYCVGCERFYTEKELEGGKCPQHEKELEFITEKNYFFRMSKYQQQLIDYINDNPEFIQPEHRKNEILGFLRQPLEDLCISRPKSRLSWGVELPFDNDYVTYVWFDALLNYVTGPGYGSDAESFEKWWPETVHLIGKDILMTHAVYWPTMLMSAGIPLPKTIFAHGWWLMKESKMSKSLGNVVNPLELIDEYGVDPVRYYLMREMVLGQDSNFTMESFIKRYNADLANDFGNLLSRVSRLIEKNFDGKLPDWGTQTPAEEEIKKSAVSTASNMNALTHAMRINEAIEETMQFIRSVNRYMEQQAPWKLVKEDKAAAGRVLITAAEALRVGALLLNPVMPNRTLTVLETLGAVGTELKWGGLIPGNELKKHPPLFPRIEVENKTKTKTKTKTDAKEKSVENVITFDEFLKVELKTAKVVQAEIVEGADRLLKLQIDVGGERRQIVAGVAEFYSPEDLLEKMIVIVTNLTPAKIRGIESNGMLLAAKKGKKLTLITVENPEIGSGVSVG
ncbi:MAG: methionine--tRNA ligase [Candidatus Marinimicrobia bacterium]|nr:methionine--tRNA ligase [Candidatus Neomarinimicrobiota bacterium]